MAQKYVDLKFRVDSGVEVHFKNAFLFYNNTVFTLGFTFTYTIKIKEEENILLPF